MNAKYTAYKLKLPNISRPDEVESFEWTEVSDRLKGSSNRPIDDNTGNVIIMFCCNCNGELTVTNLMQLVLLLLIVANGIVSTTLQVELSPKVRIGTIASRGRGVLASADINAGELLIKEAPTLTLSVQDKWFRPTDSYQSSLLERQFLRLAPQQQRDVLDLYSFYSDDLLGRFQTNAYPTSYLGKRQASIFPTISRINSECCANVHFNFNAQCNHATVYAIRDIKKDEEILNCYIGSYQSRADRQEYLFSKFGFRCSCRVCTLTGPALIGSDRNRVRLQELREEIEGMLKCTSTDSDALVSELQVDFQSLDARSGAGLVAPLTSCPAYRNNSEVLRSTIDMLRHHILTVERPADRGSQTFAFGEISDLLSALHASALCLNESTPRNVAWSEDELIDEGIANNAVHIYECCKYAFIAANRQVKLLKV
jgi:hypothetical protein